LVLLGESGTGKTHLLIGLGLAACEEGRRVRYVTTAALVNELAEAAGQRQLSRVVARYGRLDLLLLDELGYVKLDPHGAELLFQIITEREERASIGIGTNLPFSKAHMFAATCARHRLKMHGFAGPVPGPLTRDRDHMLLAASCAAQAARISALSSGSVRPHPAPHSSSRPDILPSGRLITLSAYPKRATISQTLRPCPGSTARRRARYRAGGRGG